MTSLMFKQVLDSAELAYESNILYKEVEILLLSTSTKQRE